MHNNSSKALTLIFEWHFKIVINKVSRKNFQTFILNSHSQLQLFIVQSRFRMDLSETLPKTKFVVSCFILEMNIYIKSSEDGELCDSKINTISSSLHVRGFFSLRLFPAITDNKTVPFKVSSRSWFLEHCRFSSFSSALRSRLSMLFSLTSK